MVDGESKSRREGKPCRKKPRGLDGEGGAVAFPGKPEPSEREDMGMVSGDGKAGRAVADPLMEDEGDPNQMATIGDHEVEIVRGDREAHRAGADTAMKGGEPKQTGVTGGDADEGRDRSVYLVACHSDWPRVSRPYSVYKLPVAPPGVSSPSPAISERLKERTRLKCFAGGKTFTSVRSTYRAWIVGVGGEPGTVIFDTETRKVILGPDLKSPKSCPVLTAVGDKVYALSRRPSWKWKSSPDFPPWFEVLDLEGAVVVHREGSDHLEGCSWKSLEIPPCLPWKLTPLQYTRLPMAVAESYVVVDSYILVSFNQPWGTYAFDTNLHKWHKVDSNELPFVGYAAPLGSIFLGSSKQRHVIEAYCINVKASDQDHALKLSITVLPVYYDEEGEELDEDSFFFSSKVEIAADPCFLSLENGRFCLPSFLLDTNSMTLLSNHDDWFARKASVNLRTYQIDNSSLLETPEETLQAMKPVIVFSSRVEQAFTVSDVHHGFSQGFTFLSI